MKVIIFFALFMLSLQNRESIANYINPPPIYSLAHDKQVTLYATRWCGYCKKTRKLLADNNISYFEYDIETSKEGLEQYNRLEGRGVPLLRIDNAVVRGYDSARTIELLRDDS